MKNKDERMKIMTEILNGIKVSSGVETLWAAAAPLFLVHCSWRQHTCITLQHQCWSSLRTLCLGLSNFLGCLIF